MTPERMMSVIDQLAAWGLTEEYSPDIEGCLFEIRRRRFTKELEKINDPVLWEVLDDLLDKAKQK